MMDDSKEHDAEDGMDAALREAERALEAGDPEQALAAAARSKVPGYRSIVEARAYLDLGMLEAARGAVERAGEELDSDDLDLIELEGELALARWELDLALERFEAVLAADEGDSWVYERLALLKDLAGDHAAADELLKEAARVDPERPPKVRLSDDGFAEVVDRALLDLPAAFVESLENVRIVSEPVPFRGLLDPVNVGETPPDILGLFVGPTTHDLAERVSGELPPTIYLFQRNLERSSSTVEELEHEIRVTLFHEIGHLLGLDEEEVAAMGLA